jgi:hypothetical protein
VTAESQAATEQQLVAPPASEPQVRERRAVRLKGERFLPWVVVLLAPVLGLVVMRAPVLNQRGYIDPWLYSGYGWTFAHHIQIFGWPYYADRFTAILPIAVSSKLLGPVGGYFVVHYALMAGCGASLYLAVRRFASVAVATAAVCLLMLNPYFVRLMLWDYTTFVALPGTIAGVALWYLGATRARALWTAFGAGICLSAAVFANTRSLLILPPLLGVEAIAAIRAGRRDVTTLFLRCGVMAVASVLVVAVGYLGYRADPYIGSFPIRLMFQATIDFFRSYSEATASYLKPASTWLRADPHIYAPLLVCVGTVLVLGRSLFSTTLRARMAQVAITYTLVFWLYRFVGRAAIVETYYEYNVTALTAAFAMPAILDELGRRWGRARWLVVAGVAVASTALIDFLIRSQTGPSALRVLSSHAVVLVAALVAGCVAAVLMAVLKRDSARLIGVAAFCAIVATIAMAPAPYRGGGTGDFSAYGNTLELDGYQSAYDIAELIAKYDRPDSRVLLWENLELLRGGGWVNIGGHIGEYTPPEIPTLTPSELGMLRDPTTTRVLAVSEDAGELERAVPALRKKGFDPSVERTGAWAGDHVHYALIKLHATQR